MSIGTNNDFVIYQDEMSTGMTEVLTQYAEDVQAGTNGAIQMVTQFTLGDFEKRSFFKMTENLINERDPNSTANLPSTSLAQAELVGVKIHRSIHNQNTLDAFRKIGSDASLMSFVLGRQVGSAVALDYLNTGLVALTAAIESLGGDAVLDVADGTTPVTVDASLLNQVRAKLGDRALSRLRAWVMSSKSYFDLVGSQIADKVTGSHDVVIYGGTPATLNLPVYVTDSEALMDTDAGEYKILGLVEGALTLNQSEDDAVVSELVGGLANIVARFQFEYAYNVSVKGFAYAGVKNPSKSVLGNSASWDYSLDSVKDGAGVLLVTN